MADKNTLEELKNLKGAYETLFSTDDGKKILDDLKDKYFFYKSTFDSEHSRMSYNEGQRMLALYIMDMADLHSTMIQDMEKPPEETENLD